MEDIRLYLTDIQKELDVPQDRQFPLALNFTAGSLKNIEARTSNYSLEFRIPATKTNKSALGHLDLSTVDDSQSNILSKHPCVVKTQGMPIFTGDFKLLGVVNDRGFEEFKCILLGSNVDWAEILKDKKLNDYDWGNLTLSKNNIVTSWSNTYVDGYTFPLINYGAWTSAKEIKTEDFRPAIFMRSLFEKAFADTDIDYSLQVDTEADDFFHATNNPVSSQVIFPYTGDNWKLPESTVTNLDFTANNTNEQTIPVDSILAEEFLAAPETGQGTTSIPATSDRLSGAGSTLSDNSSSMRLFVSETNGGGNQPIDFSAITPDSYAIVPFANNANIKTPQPFVCRIIGFGYANYEGSETNGTRGYIDVITSVGGANQVNKEPLPTNIYTTAVVNALGGLERPTPFKVRIAKIYAGDENPFDIDFNTVSGAGSSNFSTSTDKFTAPIATSMNFNYTAKAFSYERAGISVNPNLGAFTFRLLRQSGSEIRVIGEDRIVPSASNESGETVNFPITYTVFGQQKTINIQANLYNINFQSDRVDLQAGDTVWVDVVGEHTDTSRINALFYNQASEKGDRSQTILRVRNSELTPVVQEEIIKGANLDVETVLDDRYSVLDYIKGCIHAFNLMVETDPITKVIKMKTRDEYYKANSEAIDWTDKIDSKKQYVIDYLDFYKRDIIFKFKDDSSDGHMKETNKVLGYIKGSQEDDIGDRFQKGTTSFENPLFAYTDIYLDNSPNLMSEGFEFGAGFYLPRMWTTFSSNFDAPSVSTKFLPRILLYSYTAHQTATGEAEAWKFEGDNYTSMPTALPHDCGSNAPELNFDIHLGYNNVDAGDTGLVRNYYQNTISTIEKSTRLSVPVNLTFKDIANFDITKPIYIERPAQIKGYWLVDKVNNFLPTSVLTTEVELTKRVEYDIRELPTDTEDNAPAAAQNWNVQGSESKVVGKELTGDNNYKARLAEDLKKATDRAIVEDNANKGRTSASIEAIEALGNYSKYSAADATNSSDEKWSYGRQNDEEEFEAAAEADLRNSWKDSKSVVGLAEDTGKAKNQYKKALTKGGNLSASVVSRGSGNISSLNSGNIVTGRNNIAMGQNQFVTGQFARVDMNTSFAVGSGKGALDRSNAFSVSRDGIVREGGGALVEQRDDLGYDQVYEEVNGEIIKVTL